MFEFLYFTGGLVFTYIVGHVYIRNIYDDSLSFWWKTCEREEKAVVSIFLVICFFLWPFIVLYLLYRMFLMRY